MGGKTAEATATKTKTAIGLLTALQAARQTRRCRYLTYEFHYVMLQNVLLQNVRFSKRPVSKRVRMQNVLVRNTESAIRFSCETKLCTLQNVLLS